MKYQIFPDLTDDEYEELKADIKERGVQIPVELDEDGNILDGHHRVRACQELGIDEYPSITRRGLSEEQKLLHIRKLNLARRHLNPMQKREVIKDQLKETPEKSDRSIAKELGVHHTTVGSVRESLEETGDVAKLATSKGQDGKEYPRDRQPSQTSDRDAWGAVGEKVKEMIPSDAMAFAGIAISQLERIADNDPKRLQAIEKVERWIIKHK